MLTQVDTWFLVKKGMYAVEEAVDQVLELTIVVIARRPSPVIVSALLVTLRVGPLTFE
jgi:hypothetical protein